MNSDFYTMSIAPYAPIIIKICRAYTNSQADFEDYYQEVCLQIWRSHRTFAGLQARVRSTISLLDGLTPKEFEGAATRVVSQPRWKGEWMTGADYFLEHTIPNFYCHLTSAHAILRHNGVAVASVIIWACSRNGQPLSVPACGTVRGHR